MSAFDEQPDGDPHGECRAEIRTLEVKAAHLTLALEKLRGQRLLDGAEAAVGQRVVTDLAACTRHGLGHAHKDVVHEITSLLGRDSGLVECGSEQISSSHLRLAPAGAVVTCTSCRGWRQQMARMKADAEVCRSLQLSQNSVVAHEAIDELRKAGRAAAAGRFEARLHDIDAARRRAWLRMWGDIAVAHEHTIAMLHLGADYVEEHRRAVCASCLAPHDVESGAMAAHVRACPSNPMVAELAALRALVACFPPGVLAEVAEVLVAGGIRHGCAAHESGGGQTFDDHLRHALDHVYGVVQGATDQPHLAHAIARLVLARGVAGADRG